MKQRIKVFIMSLAMVIGLATALVPAVTVGAVTVDPLAAACETDPEGTICKDGKDDNLGEMIQTVINVLLFIVGILSVIMIIIGGIMYATSTGDAANVTKAKNTIMYSIVGLVVSFLAYSIVNWVLKLV